MSYIAHIRQKDNKIQTVEEHLLEVQRGCEQIGSKIGVSHLAGLAGLLHDMGKCTDQFKNYIQTAVANPDAPPRRGSVDHSTAGGRWIYKRYHQPDTPAVEKFTVEWIANCIISHHQGLRDFIAPDQSSPFLERVVIKNLDGYEQAERQISELYTSEQFDNYFKQAAIELAYYLDVVKKHKLPPIATSLLLKYLFSAVIDSDRTNTSQFEEGETSQILPDNNKEFFVKCHQTLMEYLTRLEKGAGAASPINQLRREMSNQCEQFASRPSGIYTLSIPTGGGKTLASMRYALSHAIQHNKQRIIYVVPYTTIIEQNAAEIRRILQVDDQVLEHHSNVVDDLEEEQSNNQGESYDVRKKNLRLARDHWDRPIIFTTMVQFLNTFYAKGTRNVRRLHQLSNAVIVFDEVQSVPVHCISLFNAALNFLSRIGRSSLVLCTATQPALDYVKHKLHVSEDAEMIRDLDIVGTQFKRVEVVDQTTPLGWDAQALAAFVADKITELTSILVILNTKTAVRKLFDELDAGVRASGEEVLLVHLSTSMCAAHRKDKLTQLIAALEKGQRVICVSTQLIEAGVDISFECVIRSLAGLDSIAQAAGRCNRHGKDPTRQVYIIKSKDEHLTRLPEIRIGGEKTERVLREFKQNPEALGGDLLSAQSIACYFRYYYSEIGNEMHYPIRELECNLFDLLDKNQHYYGAYTRKRGARPEILNQSAISSAEKYFEAIATQATSVLVPYRQEGKELIAELNGSLSPDELGNHLRRAQQYTVNLFKHELDELVKNGEIYPLLHGHVFALRETAYSDYFGVGGDQEMENLVF
ncbi:CRISPR-associated helicase Cas3' [Paenibacillus sp. CN-4]|uniref:CRISPR-associated helicase Cas3' n=1 Tax=Paenibacillus nanchangensis TaxID=3348343 RepID=UPI003978F0FC